MLFPRWPNFPTPPGFSHSCFNRCLAAALWLHCQSDLLVARVSAVSFLAIFIAPSFQLLGVAF